MPRLNSSVEISNERSEAASFLSSELGVPETMRLPNRKERTSARLVYAYRPILVDKDSVTVFVPLERTKGTAIFVQRESRLHRRLLVLNLRALGFTDFCGARSIPNSIADIAYVFCSSYETV